MQAAMRFCILVPSESDCRVAFCWALATELFGHSIAKRGSLKRMGVKICKECQLSTIVMVFGAHPWPQDVQGKTCLADWELSRKIKLSLRKTVPNHSNLKFKKKLDKELFTPYKTSIRTLKRNIMQPKWVFRSQNGQHRMKNI